MSTKYRDSQRLISLLLLLLSATHAVAESSPSTTATEPSRAGMGFDLYRTPVVPTPSAEDRTKNCYALEQEMAAQVPKTYSYKPDFYNDPYQGASIWIGTTLFMPVYALSAYSGFKQYGENARIITAEERIALLRHLKAQNRCFES
ncbi:MAG: hypothetical protein OQL20_09055 [Sedimenticola sp.]|nr:hypothetical protein [Sedimenticola sp.]